MDCFTVTMGTRVFDMKHEPFLSISFLVVKTKTLKDPLLQRLLPLSSFSQCLLACCVTFYAICFVFVHNEHSAVNCRLQFHEHRIGSNEEAFSVATFVLMVLVHLRND